MGEELGTAEKRELFSGWLAYRGRMEFLVAGWFMFANTAVS